MARIMSALPKSVARPAARQFLKFVNTTGSPYHSVQAVKGLLAQADFQELKEGKPWTLQRGGKYYVTKHGASICAFVVGGQFESGIGGENINIRIITASKHRFSVSLAISI
jgi:aspartyl aminopeptidase